MSCPLLCEKWQLKGKKSVTCHSVRGPVTASGGQACGRISAGRPWLGASPAGGPEGQQGLPAHLVARTGLEEPPPGWLFPRPQTGGLGASLVGLSTGLMVC